MTLSLTQKPGHRGYSNVDQARASGPSDPNSMIIHDKELNVSLNNFLKEHPKFCFESINLDKIIGIGGEGIVLLDDPNKFILKTELKNRNEKE